jgi:hypothetical protein
LLENYPCNSRNELEKREGELIREMNCINRHIAGRTAKEWREDNKEKLAEYREANRGKTKEWRESNKGKIKERMKNWREENKEMLNQKYTCECGGRYSYRHKSTHERSKKHQAYINTEV